MGKSQITNHKCQTNCNNQNSNDRNKKSVCNLVLGAWNLFVIWCLVLGIFLMGCGRKVSEEVENIPVSVVKVEKDTLKETLFYVGDIKAKDEAIIYPRVTGKIIEKRAGEGDSVKKGDALVYIDRDEVGFQFQEAPVESPIDGIVGRIYVDVGTRVLPQTPIGLVVNMDVVKVRVDVVERDLPKIRKGQVARVLVDAYSDEIFEGTVERVSPVVDLISRTALVEIKILNYDRRLKPGMFARIKILIREKEDVLIIPKDAILKEDSSNYVFVVKDNKAHRQKIETGLHENSKFEVINGLKEGEFVVTMGNTRLKKGDMVEIIER
ncbi:MAG: efflux RND transporter periplasmic adaptor subunit [Candidatus Omnitrophica bacterium]|nr:efflux RND transporter periplasmic adaptor subunit [Candidatus Omnitrophota bacterium]